MQFQPDFLNVLHSEIDMIQFPPYCRNSIRSDIEIELEIVMTRKSGMSTESLDGGHVHACVECLFKRPFLSLAFTWKGLSAIVVFSSVERL
jgi:hypothetical protein